MLFNFKDKGISIKHLSVIIETKKLAPAILKLRESLVSQMVVEDLLVYETEEILDKDVKRLFRALKSNALLVNNIEKQQQPIGFITDAEATEEQEGEESEDEE